MWFLQPIRKHVFRGPQCFAQMSALVAHQAKNTKLVRIATPIDVDINPNTGKTVSGLTFNITAFQQLCGALSAGLYPLLADVWAKSHLSELDKKRRFALVLRASLDSIGKELVGHRLVVDSQTSEVVGVVGRKYKFVANGEILGSLTRHFAETGSYRSVSATLNNRDVLLVGVRKTEVKRVADIEFRQGVAIYNSETTRQAIYAPQLIFDSVSQTYSMQGQSESNRMIHRSKKNFAIFLDDLLQGAVKHDSLLDKVVASQRQLVSQPLCDRSNRPKVLTELAKKLKEREIGARSIEIVTHALTQVDRATHWDLYRSLLLAASRTLGSDRAIRMTAFHMLIKG